MTQEKRLVAIILEQDSAPLETIAAAKGIAGELGLSSCAICFGADEENALLIKDSDIETYLCIDLEYPEFQPDIVAGLCQEFGAISLVLSNSICGAQLGAALAAQFSYDYFPGVESVKFENGCPEFCWNVYAGKFQKHQVCESGKFVVTIAPGSFSPVQAVQTGQPALKILRTGSGLNFPFASVMTLRRSSEAENIHSADVIIAAGRGIGDRAVLERIKDLAGKFGKSAVAGSRPLCDAGWLPLSAQVGQTGTSVTPKAYIAFGISGASQHIQGMIHSEWIVAINKDPEAPIFRIADLGIAEDCSAFIDALLDELDK